jgi:hypothetical protein
MAPGIIQSSLPTPTSTAKKIHETNELAKVVGSAQEVLMRVKTVFPIDLFPDIITVDRTQITLTHRWFFFVGGTTSIRIEDILNIEVTVGPLFGGLNIATRYFDSRRGHKVRKLWRWDAIRLQAIVQGLVVASKKEIDTSALDTAELVDGLTKVGKADEPL